MIIRLSSILIFSVKANEENKVAARAVLNPDPLNLSLSHPKILNKEE